MRPSLAALSALAVALLVAAPREAQAIEHQHHIGLDPSLAMLKVGDKSSISAGVGLGVHYTYGINDQFNFMAEMNVSRVAADQQQDDETSPHTRPSDVANVSAGVGYVLDVLRFVPYFGILAGGYRLSGGTLDQPLVLPGFSIAVGLDYQLTRHWVFGLEGQQHMFLTMVARYPSYTTLALRLEFQWGS